jgi:RNA polymerase sigma factor (sigma-70 family)
MAGARLGAALRHIQALFSDGSTTGTSDTQLLAQFAGRRDEAAFAAIMARHGPMVMAVCRGVLRDSPDAEDAFQATFLILARKAGSVWAEGQLGGWLHRVAYRIAVRASIDAARRRVHERQAAETAAMNFAKGTSDDDIQPALHEELARLPAKLRLPIVLCCLEGLTHAQAAHELRCGEATVRRRLSGARDRLRNRLVRRGFAPAASAVVLSVAREACAVSPACAETTLRAAVRVAAGETIAAVAGTRLAGLTRAGLSIMTGSAKATAAAILSVATIACLAVSIGVGLTPTRPAKAGAETIVKTQSQRSVEPVARADSPDLPNSSRKYSINGTVLAPDGKPLAGAAVFWLAHPRFERSRMARPKGSKEKPEERERTLAKASTDAAGRFELAAEFDADRFPGRTVIVKAQGTGMSGRVFYGESVKESDGNDQRLTFRLRSPVTIEGMLLTPAGAPAAGVRVLLEEFHDGENELEGDWVSGGRVNYDEEFRPDYWPESWTTGADGRFRIEGIVPEKVVAQLHFRHPDWADDDLIVSTGLPLNDWLRAFNVKPVDARFTHTLEPARPVTGVVTEKETGRPLGGVLVNMLPTRMTNRYGGFMAVRTTTDASGRYRAAGGAGEFFWVTVYPEPGSGFIPIQIRRNRWPTGAKALDVNVALPKGRVVRGRVVQGDQGLPVSGASVVYQPDSSNPHNTNEYHFNSPVLTDSDGKFALTALPGPGLLAVEAPTPDFIRVAVTEPGPHRSARAHPHAFTRIDLPADKDQETPETRLTLQKGVKLEARLIGPDGASAGLVMGWCQEMMASQLQNWGSPQPFPEGRFRLDGADPKRTYRVFFVEPKLKLGAVAALQYDSKGPVVVRLQPAATAKGTVVDQKGRPLQRTQILAWIDLTEGGRELSRQDLLDASHAVPYVMFTMEPLLQTYPAEFKYDTLIPGVRYYVQAGEMYHAIPALAPGEVRDLGKIVVKPQKEGD